MKKILLIFTFIIIGILIIININFPIKKEKIIGKYANMNFENPHCCGEAPHKPDTLVLFNNGTFKSKFYGNGNYKFENNNLDLNYDYINGKAKYKTTVSNRLSQNIRIILNEKLNHYYEKIE